MTKQKTRGGLVDLVAYDRDGRALVLVEVKSVPIVEPDGLADHLRGRYGETKYVVLVDPVRIRLYRSMRSSALEPAAALDTADVLRAYDADFGQRRQFEQYLTGVAEAWLNDLATHWKLATPPGFAALQSTGLLEDLDGGTTERQVFSDGEPLR